MAVTVEGVALSSLLYEHNNSSGDQEGFLLGEIVSRVTDTISDSQINNVKEEIVTYIHSHLPCRGLFSWYSDDGHIIHEKIRELLKNNKHKEVVGWYKFRRNSSTIVSLRERAVHRHLKDIFPNVPASNFLLCLSITLTEANLATHTFSHTFFSFSGRSFQGVPLTIVNLGDTMHSDYKTTSSKAVSTTFHKTIEPFQQMFLDQADNLHSATHIHSMNTQLQQRLVEVCNDVVLSEMTLSELSAQVKTLRDEVNCGRPYIKQQLLTAQASSKAPMLWDPHSGTVPKGRLSVKMRSNVSHVTCVDVSSNPLPSTSFKQDACAVTADVSRDDSNDAMALDTPDLIAFDEDSNTGINKSLNIGAMNGDTRPLPVTNIVPTPTHSVGLPARAVKTRLRDDTVRTDLVSSDMSVSPSTSSNGDAMHDSKTETENKDAFAFVEDLISQAKPFHKSPPGTNMQMSHSLDLDTKPGQVTRTKGQHVTRSKSDIYEEGRKQRMRRTDESLVDGAGAACTKTRGDKLKRSQVKAVDEGDVRVMDYDRSDSPTF